MPKKKEKKVQPPDPRIVWVRFDFVPTRREPAPKTLQLELADGRTLGVPVWWYPRLAKAAMRQLYNFELRLGGLAVRWPDLDEDLHIDGLLAGLPAPSLRRHTPAVLGPPAA